MEPSQLSPTSVEDYHQQVMLSLSSARELATESIKKAQERTRTCMIGKLNKLTTK